MSFQDLSLPLSASPGVPLYSPAISLRPITDDDLEFLFQLYASTRAEEKSLAGWDDAQWEQFIRMQFNLQHTQYMLGYQHPSFDIVLLGHIPVGRIYVNRLVEEIRIIEIGLLAEYRGRGIGAGLLKNILQEGDDQSIPVTLHVERNNPALALYQRLGFQVEDATEVYYFMKRPPAQAEDRTRTKRSWRTITSPRGVSR